MAEQIDGALHVDGDFSVKIPVSQFANVAVKAFSYIMYLHYLGSFISEVHISQITDQFRVTDLYLFMIPRFLPPTFVVPFLCK